VAKRFPNVPPLAGALEHHRKHDVYTIGVLHGFIPQCKDAWSHTQDVLSRFFERVQSLPAAVKVPPRIEGTLEQLVGSALPAEVVERLGTYVESARLLGQRTAQMHMALASDLDDKDFAPEPFSPHYQRGLFQSMRNLTVQTLRLLRGSLKSLPADVRLHAQQVCDLEAECLKRFRTTFDGRIQGLRIRVHGDFHLGQVLYTGKDFLVIDFEGEPVRALSERRIKRSPLRDVAGMLRSFHYAAHAALRALEERGTVSPEGIAALEPWAQYWHGWTRVLYLQAYLETAGAAGFSPAGSQELWRLLGVSLLEKAIYEIAYELNHRPDWLRIPLLGVLDLLSEP
jgi:maltose alpha-D-glucosyltransferase/alpha-amylase